ncbi:MFS transporter [Candidatus Bandiella euplotis]|uniref:MFS transporter n=1 Tax=Candidatus Bandiella euplotis TaxID=1664265 RepID=UPI002B25BE80|nr:MFS transporter [Candidatus Bandiella woodruffii]
MLAIAARLGGMFALAVALFSISAGLNWRLAFYIGAVIAVIGLFARIRLRETPDFSDFKRRMKIKTEVLKQNLGIEYPLSVYKEKIDKRALLGYIFTAMIVAVSVHTTYVYLGGFMKESLGMTAAKVINQNLKVSSCTIVMGILMISFVKKYHPLKITAVAIGIFFLFLPIIPYWLTNTESLVSLFIRECCHKIDKMLK